MIGIVAVIVAVLGLGVFLVFRDDDDGDRITGPADTTGTSTAATTATTTDTEGSIAPPGEIPEPTEEPDGLGDEPAYDAAAQDCYDGSMQACDDLYRDADLGSDYERYGDTCAGRQEPRTGRLCVDAFPD